MYYMEVLFSNLTPINGIVYMSSSLYRNMYVHLICKFGGLSYKTVAIGFQYQTTINLYLAFRSTRFICIDEDDKLV